MRNCHPALRQALSGCLHRILITFKADDDDDDFSIQRIYNQQNKLSLVLDVLGGFLKKEKSSEFNSRHDGAIFGWPTPLQVLQKAQETSAAAARVYYFQNFTKTESQFKISFLDFFEFSLHCNIALYIVVLGRTKYPTLF